ncbi:MAG: hypothetical protein MNPFHGCM_03228 [Gemmatimonadaceae bacterium]|nr:hypothetical protein [Gemmatimonadaceae bacterium]
MKRFLILILSLLAVPSASIRAQAGLIFWAGFAQSADSGDAVRLETKGAQAGVQLGLPFLPVAIRADALHWGTSFNSKHLSYSASGALQVRLPLLQLYALAGMGKYVLTESTSVTGWQAGGGIRLGQGRFGLFGEIVRQDAADRTVTTLGLTF